MNLLAHIVTRQRWIVLLFIGALTATAAMGWRQETKNRQSQRPKRSDEDALREIYDSFDSPEFDFVLVLESDDFFRADRIQAIHRMVTACESMELVKSIVWINSMPAFNEWGLPAPLLPRGMAAKDLPRARERCRAHPLVYKHLLSESGRVMAMPVIVSGYDQDLPAELSRLANRELGDSGIRAQVTGRRALWLSHTRAFREDNNRIQNTAYVLVFILALIIFRRPSAILITTVAPGLGVFWTVGILNLVGEPANDLSDIILPVMVIMVGFTNGVHLMVYLRQQRAKHGQDAREAAAATVRHVGIACALTSLTTAIGFASLMISEYEMIRGFGRTCAIGVMLTFVSVILTIPTLSTTWFGRRIHFGLERDLVARHAPRFGQLIDWIVAHRKSAALTGVVLTAAMAWYSLSLRPDDRWRDQVPHRGEAYRAMQLCDRELGGIGLVQVLIEWPRGTSRTETLEAIQAVEALSAAQPHMQTTLSIRNILALLPTRAEAAKLSLVQTVVPQKYIRRFFNAKENRALVLVRIQDLGIARYKSSFDDLDGKLAKLESQLDGFRFQLTGLSLVRGRNLQRLISDLTKSLGMAAGIILVVMAIAYRSLTIGLIAIIPNLFPLVATASVRQALSGSLDIASACSFTICLGIAVDDTIHFLSRYCLESKGVSNAVAIRKAAEAVGTALVMTTIVMMAGFGTVMTSQLPTHRAFATMAFGTIGAALVGDLLILPALLACFPLRHRQRS